MIAATPSENPPIYGRWPVLVHRQQLITILLSPLSILGFRLQRSLSAIFLPLFLYISLPLSQVSLLHAELKSRPMKKIIMLRLFSEDDLFCTYWNMLLTYFYCLFWVDFKVLFKNTLTVMFLYVSGTRQISRSLLGLLPDSSAHVLLSFPLLYQETHGQFMHGINFPSFPWLMWSTKEPSFTPNLLK